MLDKLILQGAAEAYFLNYCGVKRIGGLEKHSDPENSLLLKIVCS
jgi:hypothetical protein